MGAADAAAQAGGVQLAGERGGEAGGLRDDDGGVVQPADHGRQVADAREPRHGDEREVGIGEPHERQRLARRHGARAVAAVQHGVPAAAVQRRGELVGPVRVLALHRPARVGEVADEHAAVAGR